MPCPYVTRRFSGTHLTPIRSQSSPRASFSALGAKDLMNPGVLVVVGDLRAAGSNVLIGLREIFHFVKLNEPLS